MQSARELLDDELLEYAKALSELPGDVWPSGSHNEELEKIIEGWQAEVGMLPDDAAALYGAPTYHLPDDGDAGPLVLV